MPGMAALQRISPSAGSARARTHTTMIVIKNPARIRNMPIVLRCGIALLNRQTQAQAIQVAIFKVVSSRKASKIAPLSWTS